MNIRVYSFFSGAGFLDLGFESENYNIVFVNEFSESFLNVYQYARQLMDNCPPAHGYFNCDINVFLRGDAKKMLLQYVEQDKKDSLVGFIGGPPCPDFSVAGKNGGISGENGKLTTVYKNLILQHSPDFFLFENVKGLWTTKKHREEYEKIKRSFIRKGYLLAEKLVNSLEYGVPQERERVILIGIQKNICNAPYPLIKKFLQNDFHWGNNPEFSIAKIRNMNWPEQDEFEENSIRDMPVGIVKDLTVDYWFEINDVENHVNSNDYFTPQNGFLKMKAICEGDVSKKSYKRLHRWRYSPTVAYGNNEVHLHPYKCRRISVAEALALQSLPKEYVVNPALTLTDKFKTIGNGVPYLMSKGIAQALKTFLEQYIDEDKIEER